MAGSNMLLSLSYVALFLIWILSAFVLIPVPVNLIATSTLIVFIGSHRSLRLLTTESDGGTPSAEKEVLSQQDAYKFPIIGSIALGSLWLAFKYYKEWANKLLAVYFCLVGIFTLTSTIAPFLSQYVKPTKKFGFKKNLQILGEIDALFNEPELVGLVLSTFFSVFYFFLDKKHPQAFLLNNILGISFCVQSIEKISIGSFGTGAILLVGLFFYDIFWVFGTPVMVDVAKNLDGPIKLLFPRAFQVAATATTELKKAEFSLLGLGDIVIPGLFVALLLRLDAVQANISKKAEYASFPKYYFYVNIISYALGLAVTVFVMYFFKAAQPALLYLVPACLGGAFAVALARGELSVLYGYDEEAKAKTESKKAN